MALSQTQHRILDYLRPSAHEYWDVVNFCAPAKGIAQTPLCAHVVQRSLDALIRRGIVAFDENYGECRLAGTEAP